VGYFLDLREARKWIGDNIGKKPNTDTAADQMLADDLARLSEANESLTYTQDVYPYLKSTLPTGWEFLEINDDSFFASQKNLSNPVSFAAHTADYQFKIDQGYLDKLDEELERVKENYPDYKKEEVTFAGQKAWLLSYTSMYNKNFTYYIPYGYSMVVVAYSIDLDETDKQEAVIKPVLEALSLTRSPVDDPKLDKTIKFDDPPFEISSFSDFRIQKNNDNQSGALLAEAVQRDNFEGNFAVYYDMIPKSERQLTAKDRLDDVVKNMYGKKLVYKNDQVTLGGLAGFLYTYEYEGDKFQEKRKAMDIILRNGNYEFTLSYDDKTENFDNNLSAIQQMLDSFKFSGETGSTDLENSYGNLGFTFNDILYHRYAKAISDLAEKGIVKGYSDGGFHPEQLVSRAEALKMILESKNYLETKKGSKKIIDFSAYADKKLTYKDVGADYPLLKYIEYASAKKMADGYSNNTFRPDQNVNLAEALKLIINTFEIPVWAGDTDPWYKKYVDKAYELTILPRGLDNPSQYLTRGELADIIDDVYNQADDSLWY
jgi:hypothetical protein